MNREILIAVKLILTNTRNLMMGVLAVLFFALTSCTSSSVPADAILKLTPSEQSIEIIESVNETGQCLFSEDNYLDIPLNITLSTSNGSPIGDEMVRVYTDFSGNTFPGYAVLSLYDDINSNGVVDSDIELVSGDDDEIFESRTGKFNGTKSLLLRINLSCAFRGEVRAIAGPAVATAVIAVTPQGQSFNSTLK